MPIFDVSVPLTNRTPTYPGDPGIEITKWMKLADGDAANVSLIKFGAHTGTHVDAPAHFIEGAARVESLPLDILIGEATVVELPSDKLTIDETFVTQHCHPGTRRVLFKTRNSAFWSDLSSAFRSDYSYLEAGAARRLVEQHVRLVGIDYLSVEQFKSVNFETHHTLLANGVVIVEGLDLREVAAGRYELICLPLRLSEGSGDGAPARAVLRTIDHS